MPILAITIVVGVLTTLGFGFALGGGSFSFWYGIMPGMLAFMGTQFGLSRFVFKKVQDVMAEAEPLLQTQKVDPAIEIMKGAHKWAKWQFFLPQQIDGQIGQVLFMAKRFDDAEPFLKKSFKRSWTPRAMLATLYYKRKNYARMEEIFEEAVAYSKKESLLWNLYAYCLWKSKQRTKAIDVLTRAGEALGAEPKTAANLKALKNKKKMKMRGWNMMWYQFHLDKPPAQRIQQKVRYR